MTIVLLGSNLSKPSCCLCTSAVVAPRGDLLQVMADGETKPILQSSEKAPEKAAASVPKTTIEEDDDDVSDLDGR